jgi:hypothetical protein
LVSSWIAEASLRSLRMMPSRVRFRLKKVLV